MFALFVGCLLFIAGRGILRADTRPLTVRMLAGQGLPEIGAGSKVTCFGRPVGEVEHTTFQTGADPDQPDAPGLQYLEIHANILAEIDLRADCEVVVSGPPLGGIGMIEIIDRGVAPEHLADDQIILAKPVGLQSTLAMMSEELDSGNPTGLMSMVKNQIDPSQQRSLMFKVHTSLNDINRMTASLARELDASRDNALLDRLNDDLASVGELLNEVLGMVRENRPRVESTLESADNVLQRVDREIIAALADELDLDREASLLAQTHRAFERLDASLADVNTMTAEGREIVIVNRDQIDELVQNATQARCAVEARSPGCATASVEDLLESFEG